MGGGEEKNAQNTPTLQSKLVKKIIAMMKKKMCKFYII